MSSENESCAIRTYFFLLSWTERILLHSFKVNTLDGNGIIAEHVDLDRVLNGVLVLAAAFGAFMVLRWEFINILRKCSRSEVMLELERDRLAVQWTQFGYSAVRALLAMVCQVVLCDASLRRGWGESERLDYDVQVVIGDRWRGCVEFLVCAAIAVSVAVVVITFDRIVVEAILENVAGGGMARRSIIKTR